MTSTSAAALLLIGMASGCTDIDLVREARYSTAADARAAGAVDRGWIPDWLPSQAHEIHEVHDLDTNQSALRFEVPPGNSLPPPPECRAVPFGRVRMPPFERAWWPAPSDLATRFRLLRCPPQGPGGAVYLARSLDGRTVLHWRVYVD